MSSFFTSKGEPIRSMSSFKRYTGSPVVGSMAMVTYSAHLRNGPSGSTSVSFNILSLFVMSDG